MITTLPLANKQLYQLSNIQFAGENGPNTQQATADKNYIREKPIPKKSISTTDEGWILKTARKTKWNATDFIVSLK